MYPALSKWSREIPSILVTRSLHVARQASLYKNMIPIIIGKDLARDQMVFKAMEEAVKMGIIRTGELIAVVEGSRTTRTGISQIGALQLIEVPTKED